MVTKGLVREAVEMVKKKVLTALVVGACIWGGQISGDSSSIISLGTQAEAKASLSTADREMKKEKDYEPSDIYNKAHHIIYPHGRVAKDQRTRIAVVINGDEQVVVEDRVKNRIYSKLRQKFSIEDFALMKGTDIKTWLLQTEEDRFYDSLPSSTISTNRQPYRSSNGLSVGSLTGTIAGIKYARNTDRSVAESALVGAVANNLINQTIHGAKQENSTTTKIK